MFKLCGVVSLGLVLSACGGSSKPAPSSSSSSSAGSKKTSPYQIWAEANPTPPRPVEPLPGEVTCWRGMVEPDDYDTFIRRGVTTTTAEDGAVSIEVTEDLVNFFRGTTPPQRYISKFPAKLGEYKDSFGHFNGVGMAQKELTADGVVMKDVVVAIYDVAGFQAGTFEFVYNGKLKFVGALFTDKARAAGYGPTGDGLTKFVNSFGTMGKEGMVSRANTADLEPIELAECEKLFATFPAAGRNW